MATGLQGEGSERKASKENDGVVVRVGGGGGCWGGGGVGVGVVGGGHPAEKGTD